jgi:hypothetical protein
MKTFRQFFTEQANQKTMTFAYGRFNPPTIAHNMLIEKVIETAQQSKSDFLIVPSHSIKPPEKNPLTIEQKAKILKYMVPDPSKIGMFGQTYVLVLQKLQSLGYNRIIQVAGSDRIPEFSFFVNKYNGKADKSGNVLFNFNYFEFISAGERDPDSEGMSGMSASKLRKLAFDGDIEQFKEGMTETVPDKLKEQAYLQIRKMLRQQ